MSAKKKLPNNVVAMILDPGLPIEQRYALLVHLCTDASPESMEVLKLFLQSAVASNADAVLAKKIEEVTELKKELEAGALRCGNFLEMMDVQGSVRRANIVLQGGEFTYSVILDDSLVPKLRRGDTVLLDAQCKAVLCRFNHGVETGEEARFERRIGKDRVEVLVRDHDRFVYYAAADLIEKLESGEVTPGQQLLVCSHRAFAFEAIPNPDGLSHLQFLDRGGIPDVDVRRDMGAAPPMIDELKEHISLEMHNPQIRRRYRLRRSAMYLLAGPPGTGKTLAILAFIRLMYEVASKATGVPMEKLPPRVLRLNMSQILSKWLGDSDKALDRFFDETFQLASQPFTAPDGTKWQLPVLVVGEEIDSLGRQRGDGHDSVYDRILTVALKRLDPTRPEFRDHLIVFLFTTNVMQLVDTAFMRRIGGKVVKFGRLTNRRAFADVFAKHLRDLPFHSDNGFDQEALRRKSVQEIAAWLFSPNGEDKGQVELSYANSTSPERKFRRDFLTGALVDRSVQQAAAEACLAEARGRENPGLTTQGLVQAFHEQIRSVVDQIQAHNATNHVDVPEGARVVTVRRIDQPSLLPFHLVRAS